MHRIAFSLVLLLASGTLAGAAQAQPRPALHTGEATAKKRLARRYLRQASRQTRQSSKSSAQFDAGYYHLQLDVQFDVQRLVGRVRVAGRVKSGASLRHLALDFSDHMHVDSVRAPDGSRLTFTHADDRLRIDLPSARASGERVALNVFYQGKPQESGLGTFVFGTQASGLYAWSLSEPYGAREWWPCKDHPADKADSVRVTVTVPQGFRVGSQGLLQHVDTTESGRVTYDWVSRYPIASYLVSIAAGQYNVFRQTYHRPDSLAATYGKRSLPVLHYAYEPTKTLPGGWANATDALAVFEDWFGPYPFAQEKYGHAEFTWGGGMEHQTMSSLGGASTSLVAHELAHQWFGDLVTLHAWSQLWLNEGFASYAELLYWQAHAETYPEAFDNVLDTYRRGARQAEGTLVVQDTADVDNLFSGPRVYDKGAMVLHMLRRLLGSETFRRVLHAYTRAPELRYGTATTRDFQRMAERVSGRDLGYFFREWVTQGTGYPVYRVHWQDHPVQDSTGYDVTVTVIQKQEPPALKVFEMPVTVGVRTADGTQLFTRRNDRRRQTYTFHVADQPTEVVFDPNEDLLRNESVLSVDVDRPQHSKITAVYPNPVRQTVHVRFYLTRTKPIRLELYDALGRRVRILMTGRHLPGAYKRAIPVGGLASGLYFLRITAGEETSIQRFTVL